MTLQRHPVGHAEPASVPSIVHDVLRSPGQPLDTGTRAFFEPRIGHDFNRVRVHAEDRSVTLDPAVDDLASVGSAETDPERVLLRVTDGNDSSEIEAEGVAEQVVKSGDELKPAVPTSTFSVIHRSPNQTSSATAVDCGGFGSPLGRQINAARSQGEQLGESTRSFFESKLGRDFRGVRIHRDAAAAAASDSLQADAFTLGHDVFFNRGRYAPEKSQGIKLLAHELVHVIQQGERTVAHRLLQRSKISYRTLTWSDFKGIPPRSSPWAAETSSGFSIPGWTPKRDVVDTKKKCTVGRRKSTEFTATVKVDPNVYDHVVPLMNQEASWVKSRYKDGGNAWCAAQATECDKDFDKIAAKAKKDCKQLTGKCVKAFKDGSSSFSLTVGNTTITASDAGECTTKLQPACEAASAIAASPFSLTDDNGATFASASAKADCRKGFLNKCKIHEAADSASLLKHEQGHFDISKVMANKARASLVARAAAFTATETRCGRVEAINAAIRSFNALKAPTTLNALGSEWQKSKEKAESDYDDQTHHGLKKPVQAAWVGQIAAGLTGYDPTKSPLAAKPATSSPSAQKAMPGPPATKSTQTPPKKTP